MRPSDKNSLFFFFRLIKHLIASHFFDGMIGVSTNPSYIAIDERHDHGWRNVAMISSWHPWKIKAIVSQSIRRLQCYPSCCKYFFLRFSDSIRIQWSEWIAISSCYDIDRDVWWWLQADIKLFSHNLKQILGVLTSIHQACWTVKCSLEDFYYLSSINRSVLICCVLCLVFFYLFCFIL